MENLVQDISYLVQTINRKKNGDPRDDFRPKSFKEYRIEQNHFGYYNSLITINLFQSTRVSELKEIVKSFSLLKEDWDGYGGYPPSNKVVANSIYLIEGLPSEVFVDYDNENLFPNPNGTISIEWRKNQNVVGVEIGKEYGVFFSLIDNQFVKGFEKIQFSDTNSFKDLINRIESVLA